MFESTGSTQNISKKLRVKARTWLILCLLSPLLRVDLAFGMPSDLTKSGVAKTPSIEANWFITNQLPEILVFSAEAQQKRQFDHLLDLTSAGLDQMKRQHACSGETAHILAGNHMLKLHLGKSGIPEGSNRASIQKRASLHVFWPRNGPLDTTQGAPKRVRGWHCSKVGGPRLHPVRFVQRESDQLIISLRNGLMIFGFNRLSAPESWNGLKAEPHRALRQGTVSTTYEATRPALEKRNLVVETVNAGQDRREAKPPNHHRTASSFQPGTTNLSLAGWLQISFGPPSNEYKTQVFIASKATKYATSSQALASTGANCRWYPPYVGLDYSWTLASRDLSTTLCGCAAVTEQDLGDHTFTPQRTCLPPIDLRLTQRNPTTIEPRVWIYLTHN